MNRQLCIVGVLGLIAVLTGSFFILGKDNLQQARAQADDDPQISIYGGRNSSRDGLIALSSIEEPAIEVTSSNTSGQAKVEVFATDQQTLLQYLVHDKEGYQLKREPDSTSLKHITTVQHSVSSRGGERSKVLLPLEESGIYYVKASLNGAVQGAFIVRSTMGAVIKEADQEYVFWAQDFKTRRSATGGTLRVYNLEGSIRSLATTAFNQQGIATTRLDPEADIAIVERGSDRAIIPINLRYLNTGYNWEPFQALDPELRNFLFTDRPLYRPGDTIYFKSILRDDTDVRFSTPRGSVTAKIRRGYSDEVILFEQAYSISNEGTIDGQFKIPESAKTGDYFLDLTQGSGDNARTARDSVFFQIEHFRKPEYTIEVSAEKLEHIAGDRISFTIDGQYFFGQPLSDQAVSYNARAATFYEYSLFNSERLERILSGNAYYYGYRSGKELAKSSVILDENGQATVTLDNISTDGESKIVSFEATFDDESGNPVVARRNVLVYAGEYSIFRTDFRYSARFGEQQAMPIKLVSRTNDSVANVPLTAKVHRTNWVRGELDTSGKYPTYRYRKEEEELPDLQATTDARGQTNFVFTPDKAGSYTLTVEGKDDRGNLIKKEFQLWFRADAEPFYAYDHGNELTVSADQELYQPADSATLTITSEIPDRDVLLTFDRARLNRYQIVRMNGTSATVTVPLVATDMPNIYATVASFSDSTLNTGLTKLVVSAESKRLNVTLTPDKSEVGPGESVTVDVTTTDADGNPVAADTAVWVVDKAIFELVDGEPKQVFDAFWSERYNATQHAHSLEGITVSGAERGGCFVGDTPVLLPDGTSRPIKDFKVGDKVLTRRSESDGGLVEGVVTEVHETEVAGYLILNGSLKVTPNHILYVNGTWKEAGSVQVGDVLIDKDGHEQEITSIEWQDGKFTVYNLEIDKYHTYFAGGVWVHNQKGDGGRSVFKDTAYWNPTVRTDASGKAQVTFTLPDNLTTWVVAAVGSTIDTKVGQTTQEIVVGKEVMVRPILPNLMRIEDELVVASLVHNFTDQDHTFNVELSFEAGEIEPEVAQQVEIAAGKFAQVFWRVRPGIENEEAKLIFSAQSQSDKEKYDEITSVVPVRKFGFWEKSAQTGIGPADFTVQLEGDSDPDKSKIELIFTPTLTGTLPTAMDYLIGYPYGCVEQTVSRFVPAVIAKANPDLFPEAFTDKDSAEIFTRGIGRLSSLQQSSGGWSWWHTTETDPFVTAYVVDYLVRAQRAGVDVPDHLLNGARSYHERGLFGEEKIEREERIVHAYALSQLGTDKEIPRLKDTRGLSADLLALAVITNVQNGDRNAISNGLTQLTSLAQEQGDAVFWDGGEVGRFGTRDASTALAIRAIIAADGDRDLAARAARYLTQSRKSWYWSNTFATAQVVQALVDFSRTGSELAPRYAYDVTLNGQGIKNGRIDSASITENIAVPLSEVLGKRAKISLGQQGEGQMYSTLLVNEYRTDQKAKAVDNGVSIKREYVNEKGGDYSLGVGDTVTVNLTVNGLEGEQRYGVIEDELPAGMIPINESFKNEQSQGRYRPYQYGVSGREVTGNGIVLALYRIQGGDQIYTYRARVVSEGRFVAPPARVELMYQPEINGRTEVQEVVTTGESVQRPTVPSRKAEGNTRQALAAIVLLVLVVGGIGLLGYLKPRMSKKPDSTKGL